MPVETLKQAFESELPSLGCVKCDSGMLTITQQQFDKSLLREVAVERFKVSLQCEGCGTNHTRVYVEPIS